MLALYFTLYNGIKVESYLILSASWKANMNAFPTVLKDFTEVLSICGLICFQSTGKLIPTHSNPLSWLFKGVIEEDGVSKLLNDN